MAAITELSASETALRIKRREISAVEVMEAYLDRINEINPVINAITDVQAENALKQADLADKAVLRQGHLVGSLHGVPLTVKSSIAAAGCRFECGTPLRRGTVADSDAHLVSHLKRSGAIIVGTTNVPEFLMAYETDNAIYGRTNSPLDPEYSPGGSSGGCAAAVAAGCSAGSFGSDAGGSIRVPAHCCGLFGFKPTPGWISRTGHWPSVAGPSTMLASVGPIARTAEDLELLFSIASGFDPLDISSSRLASQPWHHGGDDIVRQYRVGWFDEAWDTPVTAETRKAVADAARALQNRGFVIERIKLRGLEQAPSVWWRLFGVCLKTLIEASIEKGHRLHPLSYEAMAGDEEEAAFGYRDLLMTWVAQDQMRAKLAEQMKKYPILLCPVAAVPAFRHGQREWSIDGETLRYPHPFVYSQCFNLFGVPAATVPAGRSPEGMPIGVQIVGKPDEDIALALAAIELEAGLRGD